MAVLYNRHKRDEIAVRIPKEFTPEDRGYDTCCDCEFMAIASSTSDDPWKNSQNTGWYFGEDTEFSMYKDDVLTAYQPATQSFPNDTSAKYYTINWKDVLASDGTGCFTVKAAYNIAGISGTVLVNTYRLFEYSQVVVEGHVMLKSVFNNANEKEGINFTNAQVVDCIIFKGDFNDFQPNTQIRNNQWSDNTLNSVIRENMKRWTLVVTPATQCLIDRLIDLHLLAENNVYVSDYNRYAYDKTMLNKSVIVSQEGGGAKVTNFPASDKKGLTCEFELKIRNEKAHFGSISTSGEPLPNIPLIPAVVNVGSESVDAIAVNSLGDPIGTATVTPDDPEVPVDDITVVQVDGSIDSVPAGVNVVCEAPYDSDALAFMTATLIPNDSTVYYSGTIYERTGAEIWSYVNWIVTSMKASGEWTAHKAIYLFIGGTSFTHSFNLKNPAQFQLTFFGGWVHNELGAQPNGVNGYATTGFNNANNFTSKDNCAIAFYSQTDDSVNRYEMGTALGGTDGLTLAIQGGADTLRFCGNSTTQVTTGTFSGTTKGLFVASTDTTTTQEGRARFNGNNINLAGAKTAITNPNREIYIGNFNQSGAPNSAFWSTKQCSFAAMRDGFDPSIPSEFENYTALVHYFHSLFSRAV